MTRMTIQCQKSANKFDCEQCDFKCSKESSMIEHLYTRKHIQNDKWLIIY